MYIEILIVLPMEGDVVLDSVHNSDHKRISISHFQGWPWELSIYSNCAVSPAQPPHWCGLNLYQSEKRRRIYYQVHPIWE